MSNKAGKKGDFLKSVFLGSPAGMPITSNHLTVNGVSRQLAYSYTLSGWLKPLGRGYFMRSGDTLTETGAVAALVSNGINVHFSGKTALALQGYSHYLPLGQGPVYLSGRGVRKLPDWFEEKFKVNLSSGQLFNESAQIEQRLCVKRLTPDTLGSPYVSEPERALLEMLDNITSHQSVAEARQVMEGMFSLNPHKIEKLLVSCVKVKVKRLFWALAEKAGLPVISVVNMAEIDFGADAPYVVHGKNVKDTIMLRNPLTCK